MTSERKMPKISKKSVLIWLAAIVALLAYCSAEIVSFGRAYSEAREPANVFEEMYWSAIDGSSWAAVSAEGGFIFPGRYLLAALNPFKEDQMERAGFAWTPRRRSAGIEYHGFFDSEEMLGPDYDVERFDHYYGNWLYPVDWEYELASGEKVYVKGIELRCKGMTRLALDSDCEIFFFITTNKNDRVRYGPYVECREMGLESKYCIGSLHVLYDSTDKSVTYRICHREGYDGEGLRAIAEKALATFSDGYFSAAESRFSQDDLGALNDLGWEFHPGYIC